MPDSKDFGTLIKLPKIIPMSNAMRMLLNAEGVKLPMDMAASPKTRLNKIPLRLDLTVSSIIEMQN